MPRRPSPCSRRTVLRAAALSTVVALSGCASIPDDGVSTDPTTRTTVANHTRSRTATATETTQSLPDGTFSFEAEVLSQATASRPSRVAARLTNETDRRVSLRMGPALLFSDTAGGEVRTPRPLVVLPETNVGPNEPPSGRVDGCWRWESERFVQSILETYPLDPGESVFERYDVYTSASADECFPPGEYYLDDVADVSGGRLTLTLVLVVAADRTLSVRTALSGVGAPSLSSTSSPSSPPDGASTDGV